MSKSYRIETISDMVKAVTPENIDRFMEDLKNYLMLRIFIEGSNDKLVEAKPYIVWTDDGKSSGKVNFTDNDGKTIAILEMNDI